MLLQLPIIISLYNIVTTPLRWLCDLSGETISSVFARIQELYSSGTMNENKLSPNVFKSLADGVAEGRFSQIDMISCIKTAPEQFSEWISVDALPNFHIFGSVGDLSQTPSFSPFNWMVIVPILIFVAQYLGTKLTRKFSYQPMAEKQNNTSMNIMEFTMPLLSVWISFSLPAVVGLYWIYQNVAGVAQQFILSKVMPLPRFTEEDYKEAERTMNVSAKKKKKVRSLHRIDEEDELPPRDPSPQLEAAAGAPEEKREEAANAASFAPEPAKLKAPRPSGGGNKYSKTGKRYNKK